MPWPRLTPAGLHGLYRHRSRKAEEYWCHLSGVREISLATLDQLNARAISLFGCGLVRVLSVLVP